MITLYLSKLSLNFNSKNKQAYSTQNKDLINPYFITGFVDAEGTFNISVYKELNKWRIQPNFAIKLHNKDLLLLCKIKEFFGLGNIALDKKNNTAIYYVRSIKDLNIIIDHFIKYPLISQKRADFELFKLAIQLISQKEHLSSEGLLKIVAIKASMNLGLSKNLIESFPNIILVDRPKVMNEKIKDPHWLAGFVAGEGCFRVEINQSKLYTTGYQVLPRFSANQHSRDLDLIKSFIEYLGCGRISRSKFVEFRVSKLSDLKNIIIPFFSKYLIEGVKELDFKDFNLIIELMENKEHLTNEGIIKIREIKMRMNTGRKHSHQDFNNLNKKI